MQSRNLHFPTYHTYGEGIKHESLVRPHGEGEYKQELKDLGWEEQLEPRSFGNFIFQYFSRFILPHRMICFVRSQRFLFIHHHIDFHFKGGTFSVYFNYSLIDFLGHPTNLESVHQLRHLRRRQRHHHRRRRRLAAHC